MTNNNGNSEALRILVVDDTVIYRRILARVIDGIENAEVVGSAENGQIALEQISAVDPQLILLDVTMPVMNGLETLKEIKKRYPEIDVVMISGINIDQAGLTLEALELGALDFIGKPTGTSSEDSLTVLKTKLEPIVDLVQKRAKPSRARERHRPPVRRVAQRAAAAEPVVVPPPVPEVVVPVKRKIGKIDIIAVGVSTGGPKALNSLVPALSANIPVPIVAVQHMPPLFTTSLTQNLDRISGLRVVEGKNGDKLKPGWMYFAPGGKHMVIRGSSSSPVIGINDSPPVHHSRPSVDVLFRSVGRIFSGNVLTLIMTGMGSDGADGVSSIRRTGGYSLVQDEATSVVWGMPGVVAERGCADEILPLPEIPARIMQIFNR